jgi:uncharacterized protein (DUF2147 family)
LTPKHGFAAIAASVAMAAGIVPAHAAPSPFGLWLTDDHSAVVRVSPCGPKACGVIERVLDPRAPLNDVNNPDRGRRSHRLVGTTVLSGFLRSGAGWINGQAYDPKSGNSYQSRLMIQSDGKLRVTGCVLFVCRSRLWTPAAK